MKKPHLLLTILFASCFWLGCTQSPKVEYIEVEALPVSDIYTTYRVTAYLDKNGNSHENQAKWYVNRCKQLQNTNPTKAIWNIKRAITLYPNASYYRLLAELLYTQNSFKELSDCNELVQTMSTQKGGKQHDFYPLTESELCNYVVYTYKGSGYYPFNLVAFIEDNEYSHKSIREKLRTHEALQTQLTTQEFNSFLASLLSEDEQKALENSPETFRFLLSKCSLVQQISETKHTIPLFNFSNSNAMDMSENPLDFLSYNFFKERAEATHWCRIEPKAYVQLADSNILLHYVVDTSITGVTLDKRNIYHVLATYTTQGKPIDYLIAGKQCGDELHVFSFNNQTVSINQFKRVWRFGKDDYRFDNEVTNEFYVGTVHYRLGSNGQFTKF